jgi:hypothetical protein
MVVGDGGSSFEILKNLVHNLPAMALPKWTKNRTQVIYIEDLISVIQKSINNPFTIFNIGFFFVIFIFQLFNRSFPSSEDAPLISYYRGVRVCNC